MKCLIVAVIVCLFEIAECFAANGFVVSTAFSLANPGQLVKFAPTDPNQYLLVLNNSLVEYYDGIATNQKEREFYLYAASGFESWFDVYDADSLKQKTTIWLTTTYACADYQFDLNINGGILFGIFYNPNDNNNQKKQKTSSNNKDESHISVAIIDRVNGTINYRVNLGNDVVGIDEEASAYDEINHRYFINSIFKDTTCGWSVVDMLNGKLLDPLKVSCEKDLVNVAYSQSNNQLIGILDSAEVCTIDISTGEFHNLFNTSTSGDHRILGPSLLISESKYEDRYYTQLSTGAPVQTHIIEVILKKDGKPYWHSFPHNKFGDIFNELAFFSN